MLKAVVAHQRIACRTADGVLGVVQRIRPLGARAKRQLALMLGGVLLTLKVRDGDGYPGALVGMLHLVILGYPLRPRIGELVLLHFCLESLQLQLGLHRSFILMHKS